VGKARLVLEAARAQGRAAEFDLVGKIVERASVW
jgi:hypothetical protein